MRIQRIYISKEIDWMLRSEDLYRVVHCSEEAMLKIATTFLKERAEQEEIRED